MRSHRGPREIQPVITCYTIFDKFFPTCGLLDYTEGIYQNKPDTPYEVAQHNQITYLLDEVGCAKGVRILDVGCGNGTLLDEVARRGGVGIGITISPEQVDLCRKRGLDVRLLNYKDIGEQWNGSFDAIVANGPMEHFVQPIEAVENRRTRFTPSFLRIVHRLIHPEITDPTTGQHDDPFCAVSGPGRPVEESLSITRGNRTISITLSWRRVLAVPIPPLVNSDDVPRGCFELVNEVDGTHDYCLTSEEWLRRIRAALRTTIGAKIFSQTLPSLVHHPKQFATMLMCMLITESWNWQFREPNPPTRLLRQTWVYQDAAKS